MIQQFHVLESTVRKCSDARGMTYVQDVYYSIVYTSEKVGVAKWWYIHMIECRAAVKTMR